MEPNAIKLIMSPTNVHSGERNYMDTIESFSGLNLSPNVCPVELQIVKQPSSFHRARYLTEGVRTAVTDKCNMSFPTVHLVGYDQMPLRVICYVGDATAVAKPHPFYRICKVNAKNVNQVSEINFGRTVAIEFFVRPVNGMQAMVNCIGIVKKRLFEINSRDRKVKSKYSGECEGKPGACRLVFECKHPRKDCVLRAVSDVIVCKETLKAPEMHRISHHQCKASGGEEMFIFGRNFAKDAKIIVKHGDNWRKVMEPQKEFHHKTHLVCTVPAFDAPSIDLKLTGKIEVQIYVVSSGKLSNPLSFKYFA